jgi:hypothetical protein
MADTPDLAAYLDHFRARVLQDALNEATGAYWNRRAQTFEDARSRPGDYAGEATPEAIAARGARLAGIAQACRARATLAHITDTDPEAILAAIREAA